MKRSSIIGGFFAAILMSCLAGAALAGVFNITPMQGTIAFAGTGITLGMGMAAIQMFTPGNSYPTYSTALKAVTVEIWTEYIIGNIFKLQTFLQYAYDESRYVLSGSVVHIPQAGAKPTVVKNRSSYPAVAVQRTDTDVTYPLDVFTTDPTHIAKAETLEVSYDKMGSVLDEHVQSLGETIGDEILYTWRPTAAAQILRTTGGSVASHLSGTTGNRKKFLKEDLKAAQTRMNAQGIPAANRYALFDAETYAQLMEDSSLVVRDGANGGELNLGEGVIRKLYGFNILDPRMTTLRYDNSGTPVPKPLNAADATDDNAAVLCWHKDAVSKAVGTTDFFENKSDALYYGDVYSALQKVGGRKRRSDGKGVIAIVQGAI